MIPPINNSYWVQARRMLAGEYPGDLDPEKAELKMTGLLTAGVNLFVDLTHEHELNPYTSLLKSTTHVRMPITDQSIPSVELMVKILDLLDQALEKGQMPYIHCWGGIGRTGTVVGCWLARHGDGGEAGLKQMKELWKSCSKSSKTHSPETKEQENFIRKWREEQ